MEHYEGRIISEQLEFFLLNHSNLGDLNDYTQGIVDELSFEFLFSYCDYGKGKDKFEIIEPLLYTKNYLPGFEWIKKTDDVELKKLWNYLEKGRSIQNDQPFIPIDDNFEVLGFWNKDEVQILKKRLEPLIEKARKSEWLIPKMLKRMVGFSETDRALGFELVLLVLNELEENKTEIIFDIE